MIVEPLRMDHLSRIIVQDKQLICEIPHDVIVQNTEALAGIREDDGEVIFVIGRVEIWKGRWQLWSMLSVDACDHMLAITRAVKRVLPLCVGRLEVIVQSDFPEAHRWAKLLGFSFHHHEERYLPNGGDADIYVRFS